LHSHGAKKNAENIFMMKLTCVCVFGNPLVLVLTSLADGLGSSWKKLG